MYTPKLKLAFKQWNKWFEVKMGNNAYFIQSKWRLYCIIFHLSSQMKEFLGGISKLWVITSK